MKYNYLALYLSVALEFAAGTFMPYISGGSFVSYSEYPHSVFLIVKCEQIGACGGSILNQNIILTAAHCTENCVRGHNHEIQAKYGHEDLDKMNTARIQSYVSHEHYNETTVVNDISMMMTKEAIKFCVMRRVIIMKQPPIVETGYVAGWGFDETGTMKSLLKHTSCKIQSPDVCLMGFGYLKPGTFCAGPVTGVGAAKQGDSGGALMHNGYLQIGIVSYRVESYSLVAYTNVSYYYDWIMTNSKRLYCAK